MDTIERQPTAGKQMQSRSERLSLCIVHSYNVVD